MFKKLSDFTPFFKWSEHPSKIKEKKDKIRRKRINKIQKILSVI